MSFTQFMMYVLPMVGLTFIITSSSIMEGLRNYVANINSRAGDLISCPQCSGFWIGLGFSLFHLFPISFYFQDFHWFAQWFVWKPFAAILDGCTVSFICYFISIYITWLGTPPEYFLTLLDTQSENPPPTTLED